MEVRLEPENTLGVININEIDAQARWRMEGEHQVTSFAMSHTELNQNRAKTTKPGMERLLQAIERVTKPANNTIITKNCKISWLIHVYFLQLTVQEGIFYG